MNDAHLHMVVNHFPIIGTIFGLGILIAGIFMKNTVIKNVAYILFIVAAIFAAVSMATGEGAEEIAEKLPSVTHQIIHEHEEMAEKLALVLYALGVISLLGLYLNFKKHTKAAAVSYIALVVALIGVFFGEPVLISNLPSNLLDGQFDGFVENVALNATPTYVDMTLYISATDFSLSTTQWETVLPASLIWTGVNGTLTWTNAIGALT